MIEDKASSELSKLYLHLLVLPETSKTIELQNLQKTLQPHLRQTSPRNLAYYLEIIFDNNIDAILGFINKNPELELLKSPLLDRFMIKAAQTKNKEAVTHLLNKGGTLQITDSDGFSLYYLAIYEENEEFINHLISLGLKLDQHTYQHFSRNFNNLQDSGEKMRRLGLLNRIPR
jgi:hypothetical protein